MDRVTNLEPLCAALMLRMTHAELLQALFAADDSSRQSPSDEAEPQDDKAVQPSCADDSYCLDFAALISGKLSCRGVYRLSRHIRECDTCKRLFAFMMDNERQARALDSFEECHNE